MRQRAVRRRTGAGFTLVDLLLVLVILASLATIAVVNFTGVSERSKKQAARTSIGSISTALKSFEVDCGRYPTTEEGLRALIDAPAGLQGWQKPYLEKGSVPKDPWGHEFQYRRPGEHNKATFDLYSFGPDGQDGGGDDVDNWSD